MLATPYPQKRIEAGDIRADGLISICGVVGYDEAAIDGTLFSGRVLRLRFDDIPNASWTDHHGRTWTGPARDQVKAALEFAARISAEAGPDSRIAVHCLHGRSRSAATALAINAAALPAGLEAEAVRRTLESCVAGTGGMDAVLARISGNPGVVRHADALLGRDGALERAMRAAIPRFVTWQDYWIARRCLDPLHQVPPRGIVA